MEDHNFLDVQNMRDRAHFIRRSYIEEMEKHLLAFENKAHDNNIEVKWVVDEQDLSEMILSFMPKLHYNKVCFDIQNISENFKAHGNLIKNIPLKELENKAETAEFLITEADFAVVETGDIVLINKECKNCFNQVENLIIILDLNNLVVRESDLETIVYMQSLYKHNSYLPTDMKLISKPPKRIIVEDIFSSNKQIFSTEEIKIYLLLYDNGITSVLENENLRESLYCIECDKCKSVCPVFKTTNLYSPIDLIRTSENTIYDDAKRILENTTFCGNCDDVCPVKISFTNLMIKQVEIAKNRRTFGNSQGLFKNFFKRSKMNKLNNTIRRYFFLQRNYGKNKKLYNYYSEQKQPFFNLQWEEKQKKD